MFTQTCQINLSMKLAGEHRQYKKRFLLKWIHHLNRIDHMDHMCILGNKSSSVILSQKKTKVVLKVENDGLKVPKQDEAKMDGVINPQLQFQSILIRKFWCSQNATNQPKSTVELRCICPRGLTGPPAVTPTK